MATALALFGCETAYVSVIPANAIGDACVGELRRHGIDTSQIVRKGSRLGIYFLEAGANQRPSVVIYDRAGAAIAETRPGDINWTTVFSARLVSYYRNHSRHFAVCCRSLSGFGARGQEAGLTVSCDLNYRKNLWKYGKAAPEVMGELMNSVDVAIANEEDCQNALGVSVAVDVESGKLEAPSTARLPRRCSPATRA